MEYKERKQERLFGQTYGAKSIAFHPNNDWLIALGSEQIYIWDILQHPSIRTLLKGEAIAFSSDGNMLASATTSDVWLWDTSDTHEIHEIQNLPIYGAQSLIFSHNNRILGCVSGSRIRFWDIANGQELAPFENNRHIYACAFSPDGKYLTVSTSNGTTNEIQFWEIE